MTETMATHPPRVSVCIPTYNHGHFIRDAMDSVLAQTYGGFELVVVDNCSTDDTAGIVAGYASRDRRVRYVCNDSNVGPRENLNRCLQLASGEYVKILCADDLLEPECLEQMVHLLDTCPRVSLVASGRILVDVALNYIKTEAYASRSAIWPGGDVITRCLFYGNYIGEPAAVLFRRKDALRGFNTSYAQLIDLEMWFHLLEQGDFATIPAGLCRLRQHEAQQSKNNRQAFSFLRDEYAIHDEFVHKAYVRRRYLHQLFWRLRVSYYIWRDRAACADRAELHAMISRQINPYLFYLLFPPAFLLNKLNKLLRY